MSYQKLDQAIPLDDLGPGLSDAEQSDSSQVFDEIDEYSSKNGGSELGFSQDPVFQQMWRRLRGGLHGKRTLLVAVLISGTLLWLAGVIAYLSRSARQSAANIWHGSETNWTPLNARNVSLNPYLASNANVSMADYRKLRYFPKTAMLRWLSKPQLPHQEVGSKKSGFYLTLDARNRLLVRQHGTLYENVLLEDIQFEYGNNFFYVDNIVLNPAKPVDDHETVHILRSDLALQWRHLAFLLFWTWSRTSGQVEPILPPGVSGDKLLPKLHFAAFDHAGENIFYAYNHNLYMLNLTSRVSCPISESGLPAIFNGKPDWVYEEEIYPHESMLWELPDLQHLVYASINDTLVDEVELTYYVKPQDEVVMSYETPELELAAKDLNQYPLRTSIKYPKPGTPNPEVSLWSYNVPMNRSEKLPSLSDDVIGAEPLLYDALWIDADHLLVKVTDRTSSVLRKKVWTPADGKLEVVLTHNSSEYNGWIDKASPVVPIVRNGKTQYLDKVVANGTLHLALFESADSDKHTLLSPVHLDSTVAYSAVDDEVFFVRKSGLDHAVYKHELKTGKTAQMTHGPGKYSIEANHNSQFITLRYDGPLEPWQKLVDLADWRLDGEPVNNMQELSHQLSITNVPTRVFSRVKVGRSSDRTEVSVLEIFPPNFDPNRKYPLLVNVYGGPGSTEVEKAFSIDFQDIVAAQLGAVVLVVDPRGTDTDNWADKAWATRRLGFWESRDVTAVARDYMHVNLYIDPAKTAVWGWSYGGFSTLKTLEYDAGETFRYGMAVAPVTNWMFYDSVYAERYMKRPSENPNYEKTAKINEIANLGKTQRFLVMHGTADDNVHLQNSLWLIDQLDLAGVENYDVHYFPDSDHLIFYHNANTIVFDKLLLWLRRAYMGGFD